MSFFQPDGGWSVYDSYTTDPRYRNIMVASFAGLAGLGIAVHAPALVRSIIVLRSTSSKEEQQQRGKGKARLVTSNSISGVFGLSEASESSAALRRSFARLANDDDDDANDEKRPTGPAGRIRLGHASGGRPPSTVHATWLYATSTLQTLALYTPRMPSLRFRKVWNTRGSSSSSSDARHRTRLRTAYLPLNTSSISIILISALIILSCILPEQQLLSNANRLGFIALGLLPIIFLLAMKSFNPLALLLGKTYEKLNFLHRWIGRMLVVVILAHAALWINNWRSVSSKYARSMLSQSKQVYGLLALSFLLLLAFTSIRPVRNFSYPTFFTLHVVGFVGVIVAVSYHTPYSRNWAGVAVSAIYAVDLLGRLCSWRIKEADLSIVSLNDEDSSTIGNSDDTMTVEQDEQEEMDTGMTRIHVRDVHSGWRAGQHVQLRIFFSPPSSSSQYARSARRGLRYVPVEDAATASDDRPGKPFIQRATSAIFGSLGTRFANPFQTIESHPYTIAQAPPHISILREHQETNGGISLYSRPVVRQGEWSASLHNYVRAATELQRSKLDLLRELYGAESDIYQSARSDVFFGSDSASRTKVPTISTNCMIEGPYGSGVEVFAAHRDESVMLVACGSGMTFVLAALDDIVGRCIRGISGARTREIQVVWVVRHASHLSWFKRKLMALQREAARQSDGALRIRLRDFVTCTSYDSDSDATCSCNDARNTSTHIGSTAQSGPRCCCVASPPAARDLEEAGAVTAPSSVSSTSSSPYSKPATGDFEITFARPMLPALVQAFLSEAVNPCKACGSSCQCATKSGEGTCGCKALEANEPAETSAPQQQERQPPATTSGCCGGSKQKPPSPYSSSSASSNPSTNSSPFDINIEKQPSSAIASPTIATLSAPTPPAAGGLAQKERARTTATADVRPSEIRTGGMSIIACGPREMLAELGNAVASLNLVERVKVGGVRYYAEGFEL